jgi:hypothetical protein
MAWLVFFSLFVFVTNSTVYELNFMRQPLCFALFRHTLLHIAVHCEYKGITCSGRGVCGPGAMGCLCDKEQVGGDFCERVLTVEEIIENRSGATKRFAGLGLGQLILQLVVCVTAFVLAMEMPISM